MLFSSQISNWARIIKKISTTFIEHSHNYVSSVTNGMSQEDF